MSKLSGIATIGVLKAEAETKPKAWNFSGNNKLDGDENIKVCRNVLLVDDHYHCMDARYPSNGIGYSKVIGDARVHFRNYSDMSLEEVAEDFSKMPKQTRVHIEGLASDEMLRLLYGNKKIKTGVKVTLINFDDGITKEFNGVNACAQHLGIAVNTVKNYIFANGNFFSTILKKVVKVMFTRDFNGDINSYRIVTDTYKRSDGTKKIYMYSKKGDFIREFVSAKAVADAFGKINHSTFQQAAMTNGKRLCQGHRFSYEQVGKLPPYQTPDRLGGRLAYGPKIEVINAEGEIHNFRSATAAANFIGCAQSVLSNALSGRYKMPDRFGVKVRKLIED